MANKTEEKGAGYISLVFFDEKTGEAVTLGGAGFLTITGNSTKGERSVKPHEAEYFKSDSSNLPVMGAMAEGMSFMTAHVTDALVDRAHMERLASVGKKRSPGKAVLAKPAPWYRAFVKR